MGTLQGTFLAFRPDGTLKWTISVWPRTVESTPGILPDGRIAFLDSGGTLNVVKPNGSGSWRYATGVSCSCFAPSPAVGRDGTIYFGLLEDVYAMSWDGSLKWVHHLPSGQQFRVGGPVSVAADGTVYVPAKYLFALNPDGTVKWQSVDLFGPGGSPVIAGDGTIYVNSYDPGTLRAFDPDGTLKWTYPVTDGGADVPATPAIGSDGTIYVGDETPEGVAVEVAINPDGTLKWEFTTNGLGPTSAAIGLDGTIYFGSGNGGTLPPSMYALNSDGSLKWRYDDEGYVRTPPAIGRGQRLYWGSFSSFLALGS